MFELLALISTDPLDLIPEQKYPAYDNAIYRYAHPTTLYPVLKNPYLLKDRDNNTLEPGYYEVHISVQNDILYLIQSQKVVMSIPVVKFEKIKQAAQPQVENDSKKTKKLKKKKDKKLTEKELKLKKVQEEAKQQARLKATIIDSHQGYYILNYKDLKVRATAHIPY